MNPKKSRQKFSHRALLFSLSILLCLSFFLSPLFLKKQIAIAGLLPDCCLSGFDYEDDPVSPNVYKCISQVDGHAQPNECGGKICIIGALGGFYCSNTPIPVPVVQYDPCKNLQDVPGGSQAWTNCDTCMVNGQNTDPTKPKYDPNYPGSWTSLGCIPSTPINLVGWIIEKGAGIVGGIAFLLLLFGSLQIIMSGGVPEKIEKGKEIITSAIIGLVFIFCSILILKLIGVQILGIPGWS